jgi:hypothetical protein
LQLSLDLSHAGHKVDCAASYDHGGLATHDSAGRGVNVAAAHSVDCLAVVLKGQRAVGLVVAGDFLKAVGGRLHGEQKVHLQGVLGASQLSVGDGLSEGFQFVQRNGKQVSRVGAGAFDGDAEET